jgi:hypothetical protein
MIYVGRKSQLMSLNMSPSSQFSKKYHWLTCFTFAAAAFSSALLLFAVQPMLAKMLLPRFGGAPSVWAVSMCFFQGALLLGYGYAFLVSRLTSAGWMVAVHAIVLVAACLALPVALPGSASSDYANGSYWGLIAILAMAVGLPFVGIAASAPLLQSWFARTAHHGVDEPYFLYRASNAGSLVALIGYPVLLEPMWALSTQAMAWSAGFVLLALVIASCGAVMLTGRGHLVPIRPRSSEAARDAAAPIDARLRLAWMGLALVPSGLLLAFTTYVTTDISSAPFLWVGPLALYLVTFIVAFRPGRLPGERSLETLQPLVAAIAILGSMAPGPLLGMPAKIVFGLVAFVTTCLVCHRRLYLARPAAVDLTEFYLWMSFGGVCGGVFAAIVAPQVFATEIEYPLLLALGLAWRLGMPRRWLALVAIGLAVVAAAALGAAFVWGGDRGSHVWVIGLWVVAALAIGRLGAAPLVGVRLALVTLAAGLAMTMLGHGSEHSARSFFGVHRVRTKGDYRFLLHGTTIHGAQRIRTVEGSPLDPAKPPPPVTYFHPGSGFVAGLDLMRASFRDRAARPPMVGIVGLGTGAMACHARPGERWRFFEIDPVVVDIARNPRLFSYLSNCMGGGDIVMGDARLTLAREKKGAFDYLLIDAFSSDAIPVHLLTVEAFRLYLDKLSDNGVLALHISNRHLDLVSVVAANVEALSGLRGVLVQEKSTGSVNFDATPSQVVLVARHGEVLAPARRHRAALPLVSGGIGAWTDDYSNIAAALVRAYLPRGRAD